MPPWSAWHNQSDAADGDDDNGDDGDDRPQEQFVCQSRPLHFLMSVCAAIISFVVISELTNRQQYFIIARHLIRMYSELLAKILQI